MRSPAFLLLAFGLGCPGISRAEASPLVLLLPDAAGEHGRAEPYVAALAGRGLTGVVLGGDDGDEGSAAHGAEVSAAPAAAAAIGFGAGARAALAAGRGPVVALDPGCTGLALPPGREVLLVHGLAAPDAAACAALGAGAGVTRLGLPGIGHGWDLPVVLAPAGALLPDPAGSGWRRARPDPIATEAIAAEVAAWLAARLGGSAP